MRLLNLLRKIIPIPFPILHLCVFYSYLFVSIVFIDFPP